MHSAPHFKGRFRGIAQAPVAHFSTANTDCSLLMIDWPFIAMARKAKNSASFDYYRLYLFQCSVKGLSNVAAGETPVMDSDL